MPVQDNKDLVRTMIDQVWNAGRPERLPEFWAGETRGEAEAVHHGLTEAFPDLHVQIEDMVAEADRVVTRLTFEGTHRGPFRGIEPTGRRVRFGAIRIYRLSDGKVVETWAHQDALGLLQQLRA
jgi:predicted ester cyclase